MGVPDVGDPGTGTADVGISSFNTGTASDDADDAFGPGGVTGSYRPGTDGTGSSGSGGMDAGTSKASGSSAISCCGVASISV